MFSFPRNWFNLKEKFYFLNYKNLKDVVPWRWKDYPERIRPWNVWHCKPQVQHLFLCSWKQNSNVTFWKFWIFFLFFSPVAVFNEMKRLKKKNSFHSLQRYQCVSEFKRNHKSIISTRRTPLEVEFKLFWLVRF